MVMYRVPIKEAKRVSLSQVSFYIICNLNIMYIRYKPVGTAVDIVVVFTTATTTSQVPSELMFI